MACDPWTATGEAAAHLYRYIQSDIKLLFDRGAISWKHLANASQRLNAWQQPFLGPATAAPGDQRYGFLRTQSHFQGSLRLIVGERLP
jgi:hypothetical protein